MLVTDVGALRCRTAGGRTIAFAYAWQHRRADVTHLLLPPVGTAAGAAVPVEEVWVEVGDWCAGTEVQHHLPKYLAGRGATEVPTDIAQVYT